MMWWRHQAPSSAMVIEHTAMMVEQVRTQSERVQRKAEELRLAAEALIASNSDQVRGKRE